MARVFASDLSHSLLAETVFGTLATTGTRYVLPVSADQSPLVAESADIVSNTKRFARTGNGSTRGPVSVSGALEMRLTKTPVVDLLFENALSGTFASKVLKAGSVDKSFSLITKFAADQYKVNTGCMVKGFTIDAKAAEGVSISFDLMGVNQIAQATDIAVTALTDVVAGAFEFDGV